MTAKNKKVLPKIKTHVMSFKTRITLFVTLDHKTSLKSLGYICSNSQKYTTWVNIIDFFFDAKNH